MTHLDARTWSALQQAPEPALLAHVAEGCEQCDAFLASLPGFEGQLDAALLRACPSKRNDDSELAWARFRRLSRPRLAANLVMVAAALFAVMMVGSALAWRSTHPFGLKGDGPATLDLRAAARATNGEVVALEPGASVRSTATLVFRVESTVAGQGQLFVQRGAAKPELLAQVRLDGGVQELDRGGDGLLGFSLQGEHGPVSVWLVASEEPLSTARALEAILSGGDRTIAVTKLQVDVTP
ncbi:MAG: hypothetical protein QM817_01090 [Archangium sp.]